MALPRRVRIFLNDRSGAGSASPSSSPEDLCNLFAEHGCPCEVTVLERSLDLAALAASDSPETVWIAAGGDGTVNCVAQAVAGTPRAMGVLPTGTLNHFAHDLHIPADLRQAVAVAAGHPSRQVDAAEVNGITFVNNSSLGVYPAMVLDRERMKKGGWNKWGSLVVASARAFLRFRCLSVELHLENAIRRCNTPLLFVGNNRYTLESGRLACRDRLDAGRLSLFLVPHASRAAMARLFVSSLIGRAHHSTDLEEFTVQAFTVSANRRRLRVSFDGEVRRMPPPLRYAIRPRALNVIAPPAPLSPETHPH